MVTSWAAVEISRSRRRRGSQSRAWPVRASRGIQASRSSAIWTISSQIWFCAVSWRGVARAGYTGGADAVLGPGPLTVAQLQFRAWRVDGVGDEAGKAHAIGVGEAQLGTGVRPFLAHDQPQPSCDRPRTGHAPGLRQRPHFGQKRWGTLEVFHVDP